MFVLRRPVEHLDHPASLGAYDAGVERANNIFMTLPTFIDAQLARDLLAHLTSQEPDLYKALAATGFPVLDSTNPECALMQNLIERAGGHYVDMGGTKLLEEGKAGIKANVEPVAYTTGLRFSDGSHVDVDAVIWCTGFADKNVRETAIEILGGSASQASSSSQNDKNGVDGMNGEANGKQRLGPCEIAARIDATWGVDSEGEIRGLWKRQSRLDGFWVMGGYTQQHWWHSRTLALQIKAALEAQLEERKTVIALFFKELVILRSLVRSRVRGSFFYFFPRFQYFFKTMLKPPGSSLPTAMLLHGIL
ncbi:hypothetical protein N7527_005999 [Penicillium freii]|uniref:FAD/NAD(P)-binding domain-containing protein n=1 Tax=Penicillium freii TaxID=48697 RepID=A0A101MJP0_PENFR|nr:hypothetical protein N7527_005999 [Penicillium freii]KUM61787.1 hypothetical protein ACN42_g5321 [Penicillium freii]